MAKPQDEFVAHCLELLEGVGVARSRRMFGGHGLYLDDLFIAIVAFERLYLKVDAQTAACFEAAGCEPFVYSARSKAVSLNYFTAPEPAIDSAAAMQPWARLALEAALRARLAKPAATQRSTSAPAKAKRASARKANPTGTSKTGRRRVG